ncbi:amino acid ABC transporter substrate-binding protein [Tychonema sp. LEGE 07199]|uniref:amino acid ABC transporter substrate-binding protein n=1 Tax=unclassified Tychonema TaxID=2642144 RepID=UPI00187EDA60|nr:MULTISPECIES: amino acid ABC transporter substrate-binding protein [unclassified Tychonema]MBE9122924.1 amino acid ABC transporter substrate-binding protein [Tychonema sp. LEGE 07199]MBE9130595.1 amino acid ABC transporter substrate-binding protein [Tychonema sp. LEGE 07196]
MRKWGFLLLASVLLVAPLASCRDRSAQTAQNTATNSGEGKSQQGSSRIDTIVSRGKLICGVSGELPGFSFVDEKGKYSGLDVDVCRAVAAAIFDDPEKVEYRKLNAKDRFTVLQSGEIDLLSRNTTFTASRDSTTGLEFAPIVFYDSQSIMVKKDSGIKSLKDFAGKSICVQTGTSNEQNLSDQMRKLGVKYTPVVFEDVNATFATYQEGRCQGVTSDRSQLLSKRTTLPNSENNVILPVVMSKEPLAPAVKSGDAKWADAVRWIIFATIEAEDLGINSANVDKIAASSTDPNVKRLLGKEGDLGKGFGLSNDFALRVVKKVGNYGEIYDRNLGPKSTLKLDRGQNKLWKDGGLLYSPPFR